MLCEPKWYTFGTENSDGTSLFFSYNDAGAPVGFTRRVNGTAYNYYFITNLQGDVIQILDGNHDVVCNYYYDAWGAIRLITDASGNNITDSTNQYSIAYLNPIRYRGYYYDVETGFYYLQTRYYDPEIGRFISRDSYENLGVNNDVGSYNLFAYCSNNPVGRIDASGSAWCHWLLGATVVIGCGIATIATCGGFAAAATAVGMVAGGGAAFTTASTISAGAFIGSSTAYGLAVADAVYNSLEYDEDFAEQGNWGTVAVTTGAGLFSGAYEYYSIKSYSLNATSRGSTAKYQPSNLSEKLALEQVKSNPKGLPIKGMQMNDARWPVSEGWIKMSQSIRTIDGTIEIHYVHNVFTNVYDDFKIKH